MKNWIKFEKNYYDDSDFFAVVKDGNSYKEIFIGSTRFGYDLPDEYKEYSYSEEFEKEFIKWREGFRRKGKASFLRTIRKHIRKFEKKYNLEPNSLMQFIFNSEGDYAFAIAMILLDRKRSKFAKSLIYQFINWTKHKNYRFPFSHKQYNCILRMTGANDIYDYEIKAFLKRGGYPLEYASGLEPKYFIQ